MTHESITALFGSTGDFIARKLQCGGHTVYAYMIDGLIASVTASDMVLRPLSMLPEGDPGQLYAAALDGTISYAMFKGEEGKQDYGCRCFAYEAKDNDHKEPLYGDWITMEMADKEGWTKKPGSKWLSMPNQMLRYRAAAFWQRAYCPEISMGLMTAEEAEDIEYAQIVSEPTATEAESKDISQMLDEMQKQPAVDPETGELFPNM